jgi:hypothetical protein
MLIKYMPNGNVIGAVGKLIKPVRKKTEEISGKLDILSTDVQDIKRKLEAIENILVKLKVSP